jgi:hypothetical protein
MLQSEQDVREQLKKEWPTFSAADKQHCVALANTGGESSYTEFLTCLEMARDVRALRSAETASSRARPRAKLIFAVNTECPLSIRQYRFAAAFRADEHGRGVNAERTATGESRCPKRKDRRPKCEGLGSIDAA